MSEPEKLGGQGGIDPANQTSDTRLIEKAIRQRWPIPDHIREKVGVALADVIETDASARNKVAAARALANLDQLNMEQEKRDLGISDKVDINLAPRMVRLLFPSDAPPLDDDGFVERKVPHAGTGS